MAKAAKEFDDRTANALEALGYIGAATAAVLAMWASVRDFSYRQLRKTGALDAAHDAKDIAFKEVGKSQNSTEFFTSLTKARGEYKKEITEVYNRFGLKNTVDQFRILTKIEKAGIIGLGLTVASIGIGAISSVHSQRKIAEQLEALRFDRQEQSNGRG